MIPVWHVSPLCIMPRAARHDNTRVNSRLSCTVYFNSEDNFACWNGQGTMLTSIMRCQHHYVSNMYISTTESSISTARQRSVVLAGKRPLAEENGESSKCGHCSQCSDALCVHGIYTSYVVMSQQVTWAGSAGNKTTVHSFIWLQSKIKIYVYIGIQGRLPTAHIKLVAVSLFNFAGIQFCVSLTCEQIGGDLILRLQRSGELTKCL